MLPDILIPFLVLLGIGLLCALLLTVSSHFFGVEGDEKAAAIRECLPGANCGACGYSGCDGYAEALAKGKEKRTSLCIPGGDGTAAEVAAILGAEAEDVIERVAYVACNGDCKKENRKFEYNGPKSCKSASMLYSGDNLCTYACLGYGDCVNVCPRDAIFITDNGTAWINPSKCIGCGLCVRTCPGGIIHLVRDTARVAVKCSNHDKGAKTRLVCKVGCIACGKCEKNCPTGAVRVENNLAVIDYEKCIECGKCKEVCPVGCIHEGDFTCGAHFE